MIKVNNVVGFEQVFDVMRYPAGESHVMAKYLPEGVTIQASNVRNFEDLMNCVTAHRILKFNRIDVDWFIPYFPFGRHDRRRHRFDGFELSLAMELAEELNPITLDPHSDVLGQMRHIPQSEVVDSWRRNNGLYDVPHPVFVIPDQGATKKAYTWLGDSEVIQATKRRDPNTGELSGFDIPYKWVNYNPDFIIVDDICDGGGTFIGLAQLLQADWHPSSLTLAVTHGLFTKGVDNLFEHFDRIFSTGPFKSDNVIRAKHHLLFERSVKV